MKYDQPSKPTKPKDEDTRSKKTINTRLNLEKKSNRNTEISNDLLIIILHVNRLNSSIKRHRCLIGSGSKIQQSVACKKHTSQPKTHTN
jgi:hypothetical protein